MCRCLQGWCHPSAFPDIPPTQILGSLPLEPSTGALRSLGELQGNSWHRNSFLLPTITSAAFLFPHRHAAAPPGEGFLHPSPLFLRNPHS